MEIGKMTISEVYPYLKIIADQYEFKLNRVKDFRMVKKIFVNQYYWN